jgi:hypothetical protein
LYRKDLQATQVITSLLITSFLTVWKGIKLALRYFIFGRSQFRFLTQQQITLTDFLFPRILRHYQIVGRSSPYHRLSISVFISALGAIYRVSQEECARLRESVPYVKLYRYNPKHLYPKLNSYGDNGHRNVWASVVSTYCTPSVTSYSSNARARQRDMVMQ